MYHSQSKASTPVPLSIDHNIINLQNTHNRLKILKENQKYKETLNLSHPTKTFSFKGKPHLKLTMNKTIKVHPGNYCYHLDSNYMPITNEVNFTRYYGEEKIDEVSKKNKNANSEMPDDLFTNLMILMKLKTHKEVKALKKAIKPLIAMNHFYLKVLMKRLIRLHDRYITLFSTEEMTFIYMSCLYNKPLSYESILDSTKKLFCSICLIYDCTIHDYPNNSFDNGDVYNVKQYLKTYREISETSLTIKKNYGDGDNNMMEGMERNTLGFLGDEENMNDFDQRIIENCELFNRVIQESSLSLYCGLINFSEPKTLNTASPKRKCHSKDYCYFTFLSLDNTVKMKLYEMFINKPLPPILELYLEKLVQIFKYDPCAISSALTLILTNTVNYSLLHNKNKDNSPNDRDDIIIDINAPITLEDMSFISTSNDTNETNHPHFAPLCYIIYLRLISDDLRPSNILNKTMINGFIKAKSCKTSHFINPHRLKVIKNNNKKNKIIPYQPCYHLGNETCDDTCPCSARGFCEKYCACNKVLCKLMWKGCHCKGPCNKSQCACFISNRECDLDVCQNCRHANSMCRNRKLQTERVKNLGVGDSCINGWGVFAKELIKKDELIGEYVGEMIDMNALNERSEYIDYENATYMFTLNDEYTVDSRTMGNILRYANHSKSNSNAYTRIVFANGQHRICLFASEDILCKKEIFFDYDGQNILCDKYDWINDNTQTKKTPNVHLKANKTVSLLGNKRKRENESEDDRKEDDDKEEEEEEEDEEDKPKKKTIKMKMKMKAEKRDKSAGVIKRLYNKRKGIGKEESREQKAKRKYQAIKDLLKCCNSKMLITRDHLRAYCFRKGYATPTNIEKYLNKFIKKNNIKFEENNINGDKENNDTNSKNTKNNNTDNISEDEDSDFMDINQTNEAFLDNNNIQAYTTAFIQNDNEEYQLFYYNQTKNSDDTHLPLESEDFLKQNFMNQFPHNNNILP